MMDYVRLGHQIRLARKKRSISMSQLAHIIGVTPAFMSHLEHGRRSISLETLVSLCNALQVSPNVVLKGVDIDDFGVPLTWDTPPAFDAESPELPSSTRLEEPSVPFLRFEEAEDEGESVISDIQELDRQMFEDPDSSEEFEPSHGYQSFQDFEWLDVLESCEQHTMSEQPALPEWYSLHRQPTETEDFQEEDQIEGLLLQDTPLDETVLGEIPPDLPCDDCEPSLESTQDMDLEQPCARIDFPSLASLADDGTLIFSPLPEDDSLRIEDAPLPPDPPSDEPEEDEASVPLIDYDALLLESDMPQAENTEWPCSKEWNRNSCADFTLRDDDSCSIGTLMPQRVFISLEDHFPPEQMEQLEELMTPWLDPPDFPLTTPLPDLLCLCGPWGCTYIPFDFETADLSPLDQEWAEWTQEAEMEYLIELLEVDEDDSLDEDSLPIAQRLTMRRSYNTGAPSSLSESGEDDFYDDEDDEYDEYDEDDEDEDEEDDL